jgi:hypothetical protein
MAVAALAGKEQVRPAAVAPDPGALPQPPRGNLGQRLLAALRFGYGPAVDNTASWIVMGLLLSAMLVPYVDPQWLARLPKGLDVPIAALLGLPLYVCATGSTPLAAVLMTQGLSPGAAIALLLTGPATNFTTFAMLGRLHGKRVAALFALAMGLGTIALGYLANLLLAGTPPPAALGAHEHGGGGDLWLWLLGALFFVSLLRQGVRPFLERLFESPANVGAADEHGCCADDEHDHHGHDHAHGHDHGHAHALAPAGPLRVAPSQGRVTLPGSAPRDGGAGS